MRKFVFLLVISVVFLAGCIAEQPKSSAEETENPVIKENIKDHGEPYSIGPSAPPSAVGPSSLPQAQAVTKDENIRLTLPLKTDSEK